MSYHLSQTNKIRNEGSLTEVERAITLVILGLVFAGWEGGCVVAFVLWVFHK